MTEGGDGQRGRIKSKEECEGISERMKGNTYALGNHGNKGFVQSQETLSKMSKSARIRVLREAHMSRLGFIAGGALGFVPKCCNLP